MISFKKEIRTKVQKSVFLKKSVQKSVRVGTLPGVAAKFLQPIGGEGVPAFTLSKVTIIEILVF